MKKDFSKNKMLSNNKKMSIGKCLKNNNINWGYIIVRSEARPSDGKAVCKSIKWIDGSTYRFTDFKKDNIDFTYYQKADKQYLTKNNRIKKKYLEYDAPLPRTNIYRAFDTSNINVIDVDNIELFKTNCKDLYEYCEDNCTKYLSRNKRLPHYLIKVNNVPFEHPCLKYNFENDGIFDLLRGQSVWTRVNEKVDYKGVGDYQFEELPEELCSTKKQAPKKKKIKFQKKKKSDDDEEEENHKFFTDNMNKFNYEKVRELLHILDIEHWNKYDSWIMIGNNLKFLYGDKAWELFHKYSQLSKNYEDYETCKNYFDKLKPKFGSLGTICNLAKKSNRSDFYKWVSKYNENRELLTSKFEAFDIKHFKFLCSRVNANNIEKKYFTAEEKQLEEEEKEAVLRKYHKKFLKYALEYLNQYLLVVKGSEMIYMRVDYDDRGREDSRVMYKNKKSLLENFEEYKVTDTKYRDQNIAKYWITYEHRRNYYQMVFEPNVDYVYEPNKKNKYNLWTGWEFSYEKDFKRDDKLLETILYHIKEVLCTGNEVLFKYVLSIWKLMLMGKKSGVALAFSGIHGSGKNIILEWIGLKLLGERYYSYIASLEDLTNKFSSLRCNKVMIVCDELGTWSGDHKTSNMMKSLITQEKTKLERKGKDPVIIDDYANLSLLSNFKNFIKVEGKSCRRYVVNECSPHKKGDRPYFNKLNLDLGNKPKNYDLTEEDKARSRLIAKTFFHYLMDLDITGFDPEKIPRTEMRLQMEIDSTPSIHSFARWYLHFYKQDVKDLNTGDKGFKRTVKDIFQYYEKFINYFGYSQKFFKSSTFRKRLKADFSIFKLAKNNIRTNKGMTWFCQDKKSIDLTIKRLDQRYSFDPEIFETSFEEMTTLKFDESDDDDDDLDECMF